MDIVVKKDILDELQSKGYCYNKEEANQFLDTVVSQIAENISQGKKVSVREFGIFRMGGQKKFQELPIEKIFANVSSQTSMEEARVKNASYLLFKYIKSCILKEAEVQIIDFASFRLKEKKARIVEDPTTGLKKILPTAKYLEFEAEKSLKEKSNGNKIVFQEDSSFAEQISQLRTAAVLLVIPRRDFFVKTVEYHFEKAGWRAYTAQTVEEAENFIASGCTYLVILDTNVENSEALCEIIKCRKEVRLVPLILLRPKDADKESLEDIKICGDEEIIQPFEIKHLLTVAETVLRRSTAEEAIFDQEVVFKLPTNDELIEKANELAQRLFAASGLQEEGQIALAAAFREALWNAAQHGNKHRTEKPLEVLYILDKEKITIVVTDNGPGFDWQKYVAIGAKGDAVGRARQRHREGRLGGLGIMLMLKCTDKIEYNDVGNILTLTKFINLAAVPEEAEL